MSRKRKSPAEGQVPRGMIPAKESSQQDHFTTDQRACQGRRRRGISIEKPSYWAVIPAGVRYDPELPASAKLLYAEISSLTNQEGYCYASNAYFMALFGSSDATVTRQLRILEQRGYIRREDATGGKSQRRIYAGINPAAGAPSDPPSKMTIPPVKNDGGPPSKMTGRTEEYNNKTNNPPKAPQGAAGAIWDPEAFERFWKLYPKKKDKAKAIREWNRLKADRKLMRQMSAALRTQMASEEWQRDNGRAIPYPCRWLSHRRWEDETDTAPAPEREEVEYL